jgi:hypothetical protein
MHMIKSTKIPRMTCNLWRPRKSLNAIFQNWLINLYQACTAPINTCMVEVARHCNITRSKYLPISSQLTAAMALQLWMVLYTQSSTVLLSCQLLMNTNLGGSFLFLEYSSSSHTINHFNRFVLPVSKQWHLCKSEVSLKNTVLNNYKFFTWTAGGTARWEVPNADMMCHSYTSEQV